MSKNKVGPEGTSTRTGGTDTTTPTSEAKARPTEAAADQHVGPGVDPLRMPLFLVSLERLSGIDRPWGP